MLLPIAVEFAVPGGGVRPDAGVCVPVGGTLVGEVAGDVGLVAVVVGLVVGIIEVGVVADVGLVVDVLVGLLGWSEALCCAYAPQLIAAAQANATSFAR